MIFDSEYGVVSSGFGLVRAPCEDAARVFADWQTDILKRVAGHMEVKQLAGTLRLCFESLFPLVMPVPTKHIFIPTKGPWTLFAENYRIGTDAHGPMIMMSKLLQTDAMRVESRAQTTDRLTRKITQYGATILAYYSQGAVRRSIACANDGGRWVFETFGTPFEFEDLAAYEAKIVRYRFGKELLLEYVSRLGVGHLRDELCVPGAESPAYLVQRVRKLSDTYEEVHRSGSVH